MRIYRRKFIIYFISVNITVTFMIWRFVWSTQDERHSNISNRLDDIRHLKGHQSDGKVNNKKNQFQRFQDRNAYKKAHKSRRTSRRNVEELRKLRGLVQHRLLYLQNPKNCSAAKKLFCRPLNAGFGGGLHQVTFCLIVAYATERTLILESKGWKYADEGYETVFRPVSINCTSTGNNEVRYTLNINKSKDKQAIRLPPMGSLSPFPDFMPFAIPEDIADRLERVHMDPAIWWIGQFVDYLIRPNKDLKLHILKQQDKLGLKRPMVGLHVRRTDKIKEANFFSLRAYMEQVDRWFSQHEISNTQIRNVFIATDSPNVIIEAKLKYPKYHFVYYKEEINMTKRSRYSTSSLKEFLTDVHTLAMCDFVVCTMSSNVCRLVYEIKSSRDGRASEQMISLDTEYYFHVKFPGKEMEQKVLQNGTAGLVMKGFSVVKDKRKNPIRPIFTSDRPRSRVVMPVYPEVKEIT